MKEEKKVQTWTVWLHGQTATVKADDVGQSDWLVIFTDSVGVVASFAHSCVIGFSRDDLTDMKEEG